MRNTLTCYGVRQQGSITPSSAAQRPTVSTTSSAFNGHLSDAMCARVSVNYEAGHSCKRALIFSDYIKITSGFLKQVEHQMVGVVTCFKIPEKAEPYRT